LSLSLRIIVAGSQCWITVFWGSLLGKKFIGACLLSRRSCKLPSIQAGPHAQFLRHPEIPNLSVPKVV